MGSSGKILKFVAADFFALSRTFFQPYAVSLQTGRRKRVWLAGRQIKGAKELKGVKELKGAKELSQKLLCLYPKAQG